MGEAAVSQPAVVPVSQPQINEPPSQSSKKYENLTSDQNELYRETSMASVSNVAMAGYDSRSTSAASVRSESTNSLKNFEEDF